MTQQELAALVAAIRPADAAAMQLARQRQAQLAKPPGSLGQLEEISVRLSGITGQIFNTVSRRRILVLAADNGVVAQGVSSAPQSVTRSQCLNMLRGKTGMSALAAHFGDEVVVTDVGILHDCPDVQNEKIRCSTGDITLEPAMTREECLRAIGVGVRLAKKAKADGIQAVGVGEMGIGNTTTASAVLCALTGAPVQSVTGRGGGLNDAAFARKKQVIADALSLHRPDRNDPLDVLHKVGGLDIAAMTGVFLGCAACRIPVVADGLISVVAALCAVRLAPAVRDALFLSHISYEIGYETARRAIGLPAYFDLGMRLGEGSGCPLAFLLLEAACTVMQDMATFSEAAINDDYLTEIRQKDAYSV